MEIDQSGGGGGLIIAYSCEANIRADSSGTKPLQSPGTGMTGLLRRRVLEKNQQRIATHLSSARLQRGPNVPGAAARLAEGLGSIVES